MSVGEALAEARSRAGLSVDELSERTKIRNAVIQSIESDDFDACGGDLFVRGYVRALASAVGLDPRPLIREYNRAHADISGDAQVAHVARVANPMPPAADPAATAADLPVMNGGPDQTAVNPLPSPDAAVAGQPASQADQLPVTDDQPPPAAEPEIGAEPGSAAEPGFGAEPGIAAYHGMAAYREIPSDPDMTVADLPVAFEDPSPTVDDLPAVPADPPPHPDLPGTWVAESPGKAARPRRPPSHRERRGRARVWVPAVLVLAVAGVATGLALSSQSGPPANNPAAFAQSSKSASPATPTTAAPKSAAPGTPKASHPARPPVRSLHIAGAAAFGPNGLADGDDPGGAMSVIRHSSHSPWQSQWYTTAAFGNLKNGTGLLIDMGHQVTITSVRIDMAGYHGASLQLRVGDSARGPYSMRVAARASGVGGTVRIGPRPPQHVRYLLIWFTKLPPNGAGTYQATVYHVVVNGR